MTVDNSGDGYGYFTFLTQSDAVDGDWDLANQADRYGAPAKDASLSIGIPSTVKKYAYMVDAMGAQSWMVAPGSYSVTVDLDAMTITLSTPAGVSEVIDLSTAEPVYYNLQGERVDNPSAGIFIVVRGNKASKVIVH